MIVLPFAALVGMAVGSFLNLCAYRIPRRLSIIWPGSRCDACGRQLGIVDLVPVFSYFWLRGRCRCCGIRIPSLDPVVEAVTGLVFLLVAVAAGATPRAGILALHASFFILVALVDFRLQLIPNKIVYPWAILSALLALLVPSVEPWQAMAGAAAGFAAFAAIYAAAPQGIGFGDVKLAGVIGLVAGLPMVLVALALGAICGGIAGAVLLALGRKGRKDTLPFGTFLSLAGIITLIWGPALWDRYVAWLPVMAG